MKERRRWVLAGLAAAGVAALALAPLVGAAPLGSTVVREIRLPRVLLAFLAGAGLSLAGMTFQALFRNPLASPFTLGVSSGAALGAALAIRLGLTFSVLGISGISLAAFGGALGALLDETIQPLPAVASTRTTIVLSTAKETHPPVGNVATEEELPQLTQVRAS